MNRQSHFILTLIGLLGLLVAACSTPREATRSDAGPIVLFDGSGLDGWEMVGPGQFVLEQDGSMSTEGGMGLLYYADRPFRDFVLELEYRTETDSANSGIFLRFPEPASPATAVEEGYEIQIDDGQDPLHQTGAIYNVSAPFRLNTRPAGEWNRYRIQVTGQRYEVFLNGEKVNDFFGSRGREGYIGLQNHDPDSRVYFRNIHVEPLNPERVHNSLADYVAVTGDVEPINVLIVTATHGFRHRSIETIHALFPQISQTTEFAFTVTEDLAMLNTDTLSRYDVLFFANSTLRVEGNVPESEETAAHVYDLTVQANPPMRARFAVDGLPDQPVGVLTSEVDPNNPVEVRSITFGEDSVLTFSFDAGQYGVLEARAQLSAAAIEGEIFYEGQPIPFRGERVQSGGGVQGGVTESQREAVRQFLQSGKGIAGAHAGLDAFYKWGWYREMAGGGLFDAHPWTQSVRVRIEEPSHPAVDHLGEGFWIRDEIYVLDENPRWNSRVLASLDMNSVGVRQGPADITPNDYPISWMREHDGGRVFFTTLGHFDDVWTTPAFLDHVLQGLRIAAGRLNADLGGHREYEIVSTGVWPDDIAIDEQGDVWIAELRGKVHRYDAQTGETRQIGHINTTDPTKIEHGLYGIEVDPNFYQGEPYVYVYYAEPATFINTLSRFELREDTLDPATERVLLRVPTEPQCCHQAGDLEWGPDGTLYLSTGDNGMSETRPEWEVSEERIQAFIERNDLHDHHWSRLIDSERSAQNLQDLRGKILRINRDGSIPRDNPFYGEPGVRWEIYAYGLRNPYRFKVDPQSGALYIGVVGGDAAYDYDEYDIAENGGENFGWPRSFGRLFFNEITPDHIPGYVPPMWEYTYETGGRSATVGPIYRHEGEGAFPDIFQNKLFIFDWSRRWIKWAGIEDDTFTNDRENSVKNTPLNISMPAKRLVDIRTFDVLTITTGISMELGPDGSVYVAEFDGFWDAGPNSRVSRYRWIRNNRPHPAQGAGAK